MSIIGPAGLYWASPETERLESRHPRDWDKPRPVGLRGVGFSPRLAVSACRKAKGRGMVGVVGASLLPLCVPIFASGLLTTACHTLRTAHPCPPPLSSSLLFFPSCRLSSYTSSRCTVASLIKTPPEHRPSSSALCATSVDRRFPALWPFATLTNCHTTSPLRLRLLTPTHS